jgi:PiT family inorganic phosphate transporter
MEAAVRTCPFITFAVVFVVTVATVYKGLRNVRECANLPMSTVCAIAAVVGLVAAIASRFLVRRSLTASDDLPLPEQLKRVEGIFVPLAVVSSCTVAFAHGANDVANSIGPVAAVAGIMSTGGVTATVHVPLWILVLGGVGIVIGLATYGHKVIRTIGSAITEITASRAVAINIAASTTVLACTRLGLPVSTSHTIVGAVLGVGFARGIGAVNKAITRRIFGSWLLTVPVAALIAVVLFLLGRLLGADALIREALLTSANSHP